MAEKLMPNLEKMFKKVEEDYNIEVFEGKEGLKTYYESILRLVKRDSISEILSFGGKGEIFQTLEKYYPALIKRAIKGKFFKKVKYKLIWDISRKESKEGYLIAERKLGAWSTMATINASKTGSILMIFVALVYLWGFAALWYFIGMVVGVLVFLPFALKLKDNSKHKFYTLADYFRYNYGKKAAILASLISIFLIMFSFVQ